MVRYRVQIDVFHRDRVWLHYHVTLDTKMENFSREISPYGLLQVNPGRIKILPSELPKVGTRNLVSCLLELLPISIFYC